ncbi:MAG: hypothetical protein JNJ71_03665 [Rubrivivax sp.]|nr:hypothetical protein [Rubrivivax sp.]
MNTTALSPMTTDASLVRLTHITYGLHAVGLALGVFGSSTIVGAFLGLPSLVALIINYVKRSDVRGTWLESHFTWQIRTFWWVLLWAVLIIGVSAPLVLLLGLGLVTGFVGIALLGLWAIYRIARGWLRLSSREEAPR